MQRLLTIAFGLSLLFGTGASLADPQHDHDHHGYDRHGRDDHRGRDDHHHGWQDHRPPPPRHDRGWAHHDGYHRGDRYAGRRYYVEDYRRYHLHEPRRGYRWVRSDSGQFLLVAVATGLIAETLLN